jgi:hypothetical protein
MVLYYIHESAQPHRDDLADSSRVERRAFVARVERVVESVENPDGGRE